MFLLTPIGLRRRLGLLFACMTASVAVAQHAGHDHHQMTPEQFAELRQKVPLYQEFTDEQIMDSMRRMSPDVHMYLSDAALVGKVGVLALGHGYEPSGNEAFTQAYKPVASEHPTAAALGMAMMDSSHIQAAVDELTGAGAETILVMPITTLKTGGLIDQWRYAFGLVDEAPWMSIPRVRTEARVVFGPTPTTDPIISAILLDYALQESRKPAGEIVALVSHGPDDPAENLLELQVLTGHAQIIREGGGFADVRGFTLQDDAPTAIRKANIERIRNYVSNATEAGQRVIVLTTLPVKGSVHRKIQRDLDGLDYDLVEKGVVEHPKFNDWIESVVASAE
jgi:hypothetical protein